MALSYRYLWTAFFALSLLTCTSPLRGELITNGTFDTFVPSNSTGGGWTTSNISFGWSSSGGNPGAQMILNAVGSASTDPTIQQTITGLVVGQEYQLSFDYALHVNISPNGSTFGVFLDTQSDPANLDVSNAIFLGENLTGAFSSEVISFVASSSTHELFFAAELDNRTNGSAGNSDVSYRLDNVSLVASIPEPTTTVLFVAASITAFVRRRR